MRLLDPDVRLWRVDSHEIAKLLNRKELFGCSLFVELQSLVFP